MKACIAIAICKVEFNSKTFLKINKYNNGKNPLEIIEGKDKGTL